VDDAACEMTQKRLLDAIEHGGLIFHYQPIVGVPDREVGCYEELVRWERPDGGYAPPAEFIHLATGTELSLYLDELAMVEACEAAARLRTRGSDAAVSVNVSARTLTSHSFADQVESMLASTGLDGRSLNLEILETTRPQPKEMRSVIERLRKLGVRFALDDFGSMYASLMLLVELPLDVIKLERRLLGFEPERRTVISSVISMAHDLGLTVVAEGIETEEQWDLVGELGADSAQGFLLGRPGPLP